MKEIMYFLLGAVVGATLALLFAPESGKDLRANIQATGGLIGDQQFNRTAEFPGYDHLLLVTAAQIFY